MKMNEFAVKKQIVEIGHNLWNRQYVASNDGNISVRISDNEVLTTPTGVSKGSLTQDMICKVNMDGKVLSAHKDYRPSSEAKMHMEVYRQREDIKAIVHAHPPFCTSFAVAGIPLDKCVLPEAILTLGAVPITPYGLPSTMEIPDAIRPYIKNTDAVLLANHGALTMGIDAFSAYYRMETLEHSAHIVYRAIQLGNVNMIPEKEVDRLMELRDTMNIPGRILTCGDMKNGCKSDVSEQMIEEIARKVMERVKK